jgi:hypothetical protein
MVKRPFGQQIVRLDGCLEFELRSCSGLVAQVIVTAPREGVLLGRFCD